MKLGIIGQPTQESFFHAVKHNLEFLEFCINKDKNVEEFISNIPQIKEWMKDSQIDVASIGRWGSDRIDEKGQIIEEELKKSYQLIEACKELNCPVFVCGVNYIEALSYEENCKAASLFIEKLLEYGKTQGVKIATYNCRWNNFVHSEKAWEMIHSKYEDLGIKYDPSHSFYADGDYLKEIKEWGHRILHFHIKGGLKVEGERYDDPPAGMGQLEWPSIMASLYAIGYDGSLSIEPHSQTWKGELGEKGIDFTIKFIKPFIL